MEFKSLKFDQVLARLAEGPQKQRIRDALVSSTIENEDELRSIVVGSTKPEVTVLFQEGLFLSMFDASALAGLVVSPPSNRFSFFIPWDYSCLFNSCIDAR